MAVYGLMIFAGAFLLFQVQPLIGKYILPWFGGGPGVWTTCMVFFQVLLLGGYAYAHWTSRFLRLRTQIVVHVALLAAALATLPIIPGDHWKPLGVGNPIPRILALLAINLGLPYFLLSSTGPLVQRWFNQAHPGASPYRLYALSNVGSLLALISYPAFFETQLTRRNQAWAWMAGLMVYALLTLMVVAKLWHVRTDTAPETAQNSPGRDEPVPAGATHRWLWFLLPACASLLLLATTNKLCQDLAVIPFLWVLPLAIYLVSFIICFDSPRWYVRFPFLIALALALGGLCWAIFSGSKWPLWQVVGVYSTALFVSCMVCHGELYRLRPDPRHLTGFYLLISAGGAAGGLFVAAAPWFFRGYYELHTGVLLCGLLYWLARRADSASARDWRWTAWVLPVLLAVGFDRALGSMVGDASVSAGFLTAGRVVVWLLLAGWIVLIAVWSRSAAREWRRPALGWLFVGFAVLAATLWLQRERSGDAILAVSRNFYGQLRVFQAQIDGIGPFRGLFHGRITHGAQMMDPLKQQIPTMYFSEQSGIGVATRALPPGPRNIGVIGLGVGTLAAYARAGDSLRFYEIDPEVETFARKWFRFLSQCPGAVEVALGDARLTMEREAPRNYDLFVLDAFSGDAIPVHLLTREAFALYERHLAANGVIAVHISNQYLNLEPVLRRMAHELGYASAAIYNNGSPDEPWVRPSGWMLLSRDQAWMNSEAIQGPARAIVYQSKEVPLWTDDFASLLQIVR